jgi:multisubunit Na+/H+ antiporter MnhE subunit
VKIKTVAVTFTPGTTTMDASGVTETYYDLAMVPVKGLSS